MAIDENTVRLAARLYECRDSARAILGDRYPEVIERWREIVVAASIRFECAALLAPLKLAESAKAEGIVLDGTAIMMLSAAAVEETEAASVVEPGK